MTDYIEREALRDAVYEADAVTMEGVAIINTFPAAEVRPVVRGEWVNPRHDSEMCSCCGTRFYISALFAVGGNDEPNFCPNCGAEMREG